MSWIRSRCRPGIRSGNSRMRSSRRTWPGGRTRIGRAWLAPSRKISGDLRKASSSSMSSINRKVIDPVKALAVAFLALSAVAQTNNPHSVEQFRDRGLGLFIHWSVDGPLGGVISHSLVGASPDYVERFFQILPNHFNPDRYEPQKWAALAKLAGFEYVMFTTKHHAGFC